ncbi:MAG: sodium:solute symporter [Bacteroidetes bacterium]|nr:MAG: sodium:solute symporter [Bacteroidota bacterium]
MKASYSKPLRPTLGLLGALALAGGGLYFFSAQPVFWGGYWAMVLLYGVIFYVGAWSGHFRRSSTSEELLLAGRALPLGIAALTMSATWVGGGFINGTAEYAAGSGLVWVQAPWGYALSLIVGGLFFARIMRRRAYKTMLDPLADKFGTRLAAVLFLPALCGEIFWTAAILLALGTTFGTVLGLDLGASIVLSALIAIAYTAIGGLWSVAMTDVVQLFLLMTGLIVVLPPVLTSAGGWPEVWSGYVEKFGPAATLLPSREALGNSYWMWWDYAFLLIFGGIPWQVYFQRVLAAKDETTAVRLSLFAGVFCLLAAIPAAIIGVAAATTDWVALGLAPPPDAAATLPWVIRYLTNPWVATIGLGSVAAAVMSSVDSSILSASSLATWNVYRPLFRPDIRMEKLAPVIRKCIWIIGITATILALNIRSVYELWFLCSDFVYCLLFPPLVCALFDPKSNVYGASAGLVVAFLLRFGGGDPTLGLPILLPYPWIEDGVVLFPFRTFAMLSGLATIVVVSRIFPIKKAE